MARRNVSEEARMIFWLSTGLCSKIREKSIKIDSNTTDVLKESLGQKIENFELLLQNEAGPPPNAEEQAVIAEVKNGLNLLDEAISPVSSLEESATESD